MSAEALRNGASAPMFQLIGVGKSYPRVTALKPITLSIARDERVAIVGPSGSGKTTLLNLLARVIVPDTGELYIAGKPARALKPGRELARLVGIMAQQFDLVDALPVIHNVLAGRLGEWSLLRSIVSLIAPREVDRVREALARVGIPEKLYERTSRLSGGEQQRVALARLLVQNPQAILADEPVASLDPARAEDLVAMVTSIAREHGQTLVVSLHSVPLALAYFDRILALRRGGLYFDRPAKDVTAEDLEALYQLEEAREGAL